jgi:hypothetical protein
MNGKSLDNGGFFMQKNFPTRLIDSKSLTLKYIFFLHPKNSIEKI